MLRFIALILVFLSAPIIQGQIEIQACIYDEVKDEPIPFATVNLLGTTKGMVSDQNGCFTFSVDAKLTDTILVSTLGYIPKKYMISQAIKQKKLLISPTDFMLGEVTIVGGENTALKILDSIIENKKNNDQYAYDNFSYEQYIKVELDVVNIPKETFKKNIFVKQFDFVLNSTDSTSEEKPFLPIFLTENLSEFYYKSSPKIKKEKIKASKISGMKSATVTQFLGSMYQEVNIYKNFINISNKGFVSPISDRGSFYYRYYIEDSAMIDYHYCYKVKFIPKRAQESVFIGDFWVDKDTWGIQQINMNVSSRTDINFIEKVGLFQAFEQLNNKWILKKDKLVVHFMSKSEKIPGVIGRKTASFKNQRINEDSIDSQIKSFGDLDQIEMKHEKDKVHDWNVYRHETLSSNEQKIYAMVDSLNNLPLFRTYIDLVRTFFGGYYEIGKFDIGPYYNLLSTDQVEGWRTSFGGRTNESFSKWIQFGGYGAYGFKDEEFKYGVFSRIKLPTKRWNSLYFKYIDDLDLENGDLAELDNDNIVAGLVQKPIDQRLVRIEKRLFEYEKEWRKGIQSKLSIENKWQSPYFDFQYQNGQTADTSFWNTDIGLQLRLSKDEKFMDFDFTRISLGSKSPIVYLQVNKGVSGLLGGQFDYLKLKAKIVDQFPVNPMGYIRYSITGGKTFGEVPYLLLEVPKGNFTYYHNPTAFNNMNPYEFAADEFVQVNMTHYLDGSIMNKIPLIKRLKWRSLWNVKGIYGRYSSNNRNLIVNDNVRILDNNFYAESSVGIENILKLIRVDVVRRWTYLEPSGPDMIHKWAFYGSLQFKF